MARGDAGAELPVFLGREAGSSVPEFPDVCPEVQRRQSQRTAELKNSFTGFPAR